MTSESDIEKSPKKLSDKDLCSISRQCKDEQRFKDEKMDDDWLQTWSHPEQSIDIKKEPKREKGFSEPNDNEEKIKKDSGNETKHSKRQRTRKAGYERLNYQGLLYDLASQAERLEGAVGNHCRFKCAFCKLEYKSWRSIELHWKNSSKCKRVPVTEAIVTKIGHICKVCDKPVLNDVALIMNHMRSVHSMSTKKYSQAFRISCPHLERSLYEMGFVGAALLERQSGTTDFVGSLCLFRCSECGATFESCDSFQRHISRLKHEPGSTDHWAVKILTHRCRVCNDHIISDNKFLGPHLLRHNLRIREYAKKYSLQLDEYKDRLQKRKQDLVSGAKMSDKIGNLCTFSCFKCKSSFASFSRLYCHWKKSKQHDAGPLTANINVVREHISSKVGFKCQVCNEIILCDKLVLTRHFYGHGIPSLTQYSKKFNVDVAPTPLSDAGKRREELVNNSEVSDTSQNKCQFQCNVCLEKYASYNAMGNHLKKTKHGDYKGGLIDTYITKRVYYECKICSQKILCDSKALNRHIGLGHGMKRAQYLEAFPESRRKQIQHSDILDNLCQYKCSKCSFESCSWFMMSTHVKTTKHVELTGESKEFLMVKYVAHKCKLCRKNVTCETTALKFHMRAHHNLSLNEYKTKTGLMSSRESLAESYERKRKDFLKAAPSYPPLKTPTLKGGTIPVHFLSRNIGNLCAFKCHFCKSEDNMFYNWSIFKGHLHRAHGSAASVSNRENIVEARYHECIVCSAIILCDIYFLHPHLNRNHKMTWESYEAMVRMNGGSSFPTFKQFCEKHQVKGGNNNWTKTSQVEVKPCSVRLLRLESLD